MIQEIVKKWDERKNNLESYFRSAKQGGLLSYTDIVTKTFELVINDPENSRYENYDITKITVIDDGDYQGTQIFIIPKDTYQPSIGDYLITNTYYGSCSGCDTLQSILGYTDEPFTEEQIKDLMTLALHLIQRLKILGSDSD